MTETNTPRIYPITVSLAAGASRKIEDIGGESIAFYFSPALLIGATVSVRFGPTGTPIDISNMPGGYIRLGGPVREITVFNNGAATITGQIVTSPCAEFLVFGF